MYEINIEKIHNAIMYQVLETDEYNFFDSEDVQREQDLENRINNIMALDEQFKRDFVNDFQIAMNTAAYNAFGNGLKIGLSLLQNLLTAEPPELHITKHEPDRTERRCPPICQPSDVKQVFVDYVNKYYMFLSKEQIYRIQERMEIMLTENFKRLVEDMSLIHSSEPTRPY